MHIVAESSQINVLRPVGLDKRCTSTPSRAKLKLSLEIFLTKRVYTPVPLSFSSTLASSSDLNFFFHGVFRNTVVFCQLVKVRSFEEPSHSPARAYPFQDISYESEVNPCLFF